MGTNRTVITISFLRRRLNDVWPSRIPDDSSIMRCVIGFFPALPSDGFILASLQVC